MSARTELIAQLEFNPVLLDSVLEEIGPRCYEIVVSYSSKALNRYNVRPGRIFGNPRNTNERYKVVDIAGNRIVWKNLKDTRTRHDDIDELLESWNLQGIVEISPIQQIIEKIKNLLTPFLGGALVAALVSWLMAKLK